MMANGDMRKSTRKADAKPPRTRVGLTKTFRGEATGPKYKGPALRKKK